MKRISRLFVSSLAAATLVAISLSSADDFAGWSEPANLGAGVNTAFAEFGASVSRDGLSLYFHSDRPGGFGGTDLWVSRRATEQEPWGPAENLGGVVNSAFSENTPTLSVDGHRLYFASDRPGGIGGSDLYVSRRRGARNDISWRLPQNLGHGVNSSANEGGATLFEEDASGTTTLYFFSSRPGGLGGADIYASTLLPDETFGSAALVEELSSPSADIAPTIRHDGVEMLITSNRPGSMPFPGASAGNSFDVWAATRPTTRDRWSIPVNLGSVINTSFNDGWAALSFDATMLYFSTRRSGAFGTAGLDIYLSARSRLRDPGMGAVRQQP